VNAELRDIRERLTVIVETTSERAFAREHRLFTLAMQQAVVDTATTEATADIRRVVLEELQRAGVQDAIQLTAELEEKVREIMAESGERVVEARKSPLLLPGAQLEVLKRLGEEPFTTDRLNFLLRTTSASHRESPMYEILARWREAGIG